MLDETAVVVREPRSRRRAKPPDPMVAQAAAVAGASSTTTVMQAPQQPQSDPQVWVAIGRLQEADEVHTRDLQAVKTDIAVLKREGERHSVQLAGIAGSVGALPQMADAVQRIGESMAKLEARPELSAGAAAYTEHLAKDWPPDKVAQHTAQMVEMHDFFTEVIQERADVAAALVVTERIAREHAEVNSTIQMAILGTLASVVVAVSLMLLAKAPLQVQATAVLVLAAGLALFIYFVRRTLLRLRGIGTGALPPP